MTFRLESYEDAFGPVARRIHRLGRAARWQVKRALGFRLSILVETRWRLGDEIMALPIYEGLKREYPGCHVTAWCHYPDLLLDNPYVDAVWRDAAAIPGGAFDRYILLRGAPRDVVRAEHYARCAGIPVPPSSPRLHYRDWDCPSLAKARGDAASYIAVCTGASWPAKRWPVQCWQALCRELEDRGERVVQLGRDDAIIGAGMSLVNRTSVRDSACVLRAAKALVCCDSGLMHLALAVGAPVVALFGPTVPSILIRDAAPCTVVTNERPCQGCWNRSQRMTEPGVCPLGVDSCMGTIGVDTVLRRLDERLRGQG